MLIICFLESIILLLYQRWPINTGKLITTLKSLIFSMIFTLIFPVFTGERDGEAFSWHQKEEEKEDKHFLVLSWIFFLVKTKFQLCKIIEWNFIFMGKLPIKNCPLNKTTCDFMHIISEIFKFSKAHISKMIVVWRAWWSSVFIVFSCFLYQMCWVSLGR